MVRTALRASSAILWTWRESSLRRSSVSGGTGMRTTLPSLFGFSPRSDARIAFSMAPISVGSNGWATISVGSGTESEATWLSGMRVP